MNNKILKVLVVIMCLGLMVSGLCIPTNAASSLRLQNTYAKIKSGEKVNVAYLGGSVTNGWLNCIE